MRREPIKVSDIDKVIPISQKIMVYVEDGNFEGTYSSYIYDIDQSGIYIAMPTDENGIKAVVRVGDKLEISFVDNRGYRIGFTSRLIDIIKEGNRVIYKLEKPQMLVKVEMRENFRVPTLIEAKFYLFKKGKIIQASGTILDISAGGVKLSADVELELRDKLLLEFELGNYKLEEVEAEVVRKAITGEKGVNHYGLRFTDLTKEQEDKIIKFCISKQVEFARKMKGIE
ncbi:flagellar brake protein [Hippea maritima]|uniref:Type IV pilus assembly PilZ n=1 Tax=Hippea maritima (strain ATCC 700847 / DSM 10411 / MH2) TaxID=760142 RepID=F2LTS5_HIPMA|nr:PilZ domain-containing protein [Hippea maritima]AEA34451.1 type IV pilus assembly PilZ [Hippea maritima DSM 10411]